MQAVTSRRWFRVETGTNRFSNQVERPRVTVILPFRNWHSLQDAFSKEDEVSKGVSDEKLIEAPRLGLQRRLNSIGRQILLVQGIDIGHSNPTDRVAFRGVWRVIQVQIHTVPFDNGKSLIVIGGLKAQLLIEGQ